MRDNRIVWKLISLITPVCKYATSIEINYSRLMMPLALSRGILFRPRSERVETKLSSFVSMEACRFVYILANRRL